MGASCATSGQLVDMTFDLETVTLNVPMAVLGLSAQYFKKYEVWLFEIWYAVFL